MRSSAPALWSRWLSPSRQGREVGDHWHRPAVAALRALRPVAAVGPAHVPPLVEPRDVAPVQLHQLTDAYPGPRAHQHGCAARRRRHRVGHGAHLRWREDVEAAAVAADPRARHQLAARRVAVEAVPAHRPREDLAEHHQALDDVARRPALVGLRLLPQLDVERLDRIDGGCSEISERVAGAARSVAAGAASGAPPALAGAALAGPAALCASVPSTAAEAASTAALGSGSPGVVRAWPGRNETNRVSRAASAVQPSSASRARAACATSCWRVLPAIRPTKTCCAPGYNSSSPARAKTANVGSSCLSKVGSEYSSAALAPPLASSLA